MTILFHIS